MLWKVERKVQRTDGHEARGEHDEQQLVPVLCARLQVGRPVARVNVCHARHEPGADEAEVPVEDVSSAG